jgi:hypothetical protein
LFFNAADHGSMTFLGFHIDPASGNAIDPVSLAVIERAVMSRNLQQVLARYGVPLRENFEGLSRYFHFCGTIIGIYLLNLIFKGCQD